jgi:hypothetical protein
MLRRARWTGKTRESGSILSESEIEVFLTCEVHPGQRPLNHVLIEHESASGGFRGALAKPRN